MNNREGRRQRRLLLEQLEDRRLLARVFAPQVIISTAADRPTDVLAIDLDGDGDQDVVSGSADDNKVAWYENDGSQGFTAHTVTADANTVRGIFAVDMDGDGDVDLLSASYNDDKIAWYENDGEESFSPHVISTSAASAVT
ncbi:MAG: FG-GAP-like repeat-containing protein, partial [Pirellulaceae bacterium]|nr:FG-GAP-like repeat-containing protein [Pirellulaceae bacterium]